MEQKKMDRRHISQLLDDPENEGKDTEQALQTLMMTEKFEKYQTESSDEISKINFLKLINKWTIYF